jgi:hypothetical protein
MKVEIRQQCYGDVQRGPRQFTTEREYPVLPVPGDLVDLAEGWCCVPVKQRFFAADGRIVVELEPERHLDAEHLRLLELGWREP